MENILHEEDKDYKLWILLHQAADAMYRARERELKQFGTSIAQTSVLYIIQAIDGAVTPAEISRWLFRAPHTVFGLLNRMQKAGLVRMVKDLANKNQVRVEITEKGKQAYQQSTKRQVLHRMMSSISEEEYQQLRSCLEELRDKAFKELGIGYKAPFP